MLRRLSRRSAGIWLVSAGLLIAVALAGYRDHPGTNFSQYPGFKSWFAAHPPPHEGPDGPDRVLLERYRPRFFLAPGQPGPIDFYRDYIAHGRLYDGNGRLVSRQVTPAILNRHAHDPLAVFVHTPTAGTTSPPPVYGRIDRAPVPGAGTAPFIFLSYHLVFAKSGLPAALASWKAALLGLVASLNDWHQLDHYTAATVVLDPRRRPVALLLQQHNYQHAYLFGEGVTLPRDGRVRIDIAIRSNELYPHRAVRWRRRAVPFAGADGMRYLLGFGARPFLAADDVTDGVEEVDYRLKMLPADDAFYVFEGYLGERRWLPGRSGPPGADYNARPVLKPLGLELLAGYWRAGNRGDLNRLDASRTEPQPRKAFALAQAPVFNHNRRCLAASPPCSLR